MTVQVKTPPDTTSLASLAALGQRPATASSDRPYRIAVFTHDTFGLGHVRRCTHIINALAEILPNAAILLVTGSNALNVLTRLPDNADFVKIPTIVQTGSEGNLPPHLPLDIKETSALRKNLIKEAVTSFKPDVFLVDNFPLGSRKELLPTLQALQPTPTQTLLGLRDIVDSSEKIQHQWRRDGTYDVLAQLYDGILVYGMPEVLDFGQAYDLDQTTQRKLHYCGYISDPAPVRRSRHEIFEELGISSPLVLATVGGGGDGLPVIRTFIESVKRLPDISALVVTGPLMGNSERIEIEELAAATGRICVRDFVDNLPDYMAASDAIVAMGGYNTAAEIITLRRRAIIVPRNWRYGEHMKRDQAKVEWEQLLRAEALEQAGFARMLHPGELNAERLSALIAAELDRSSEVVSAGFAVNGLENATAQIADFAARARIASDAHA